MHLQHAHVTIEFLQLESQLQRIELQEKCVASKTFSNTTDNSTSFIQPASSVEVVPAQFSSKPIIKPWEEIQSNRNQHGLGYDKDENNLHIPNYSMLIKFISGGFLDQITSKSHEKVADK